MVGAKGSDLAKLWADVRGITAVEYALLMATIASCVTFAALTLGDLISLQMFEAVGWLEPSGCDNNGQGTGFGGGDGQGGSSGDGNNC